MKNLKRNSIIYISIGLFIILFLLWSIIAIRKSLPNLKDSLAVVSIEELFNKDKKESFDIEEDTKLDKKDLIVNKVVEVPVYPGCEDFIGNKSELIGCLSDNLDRHILDVLDTEFPNVNKDRVEVNLEFYINRKGLITDIRAVDGDNEFKVQAVSALRQVADDLKKSGIRIEPAKDEYGRYMKLLLRNKVVLLNPDK
ncbi:hypothetical protein NMK71_01780 [Weeksellaceae bacterium KMM 9713]|uniref:TonB C-terminal domain-containing protein n=1 Tax=Profundicola chukchiensis TaxID=2961959 RepID=A0A9X4MX20_9FLAO|nr:hypothetical protein [Profundicola chukchiensis]MDG4945130.1 hypothetical protein [Profundicola chukchiensis]